MPTLNPILELQNENKISKKKKSNERKGQRKTKTKRETYT